MNIPILSIIIPAFNEELYLDDCLKSIQTNHHYHHCEVIVVDNNSSDQTIKTASKYPFKVLHNDRPGVAATRNHGASAAKGQFLYFLDSDCRVPPHFLSSLLTYLENNPDTKVLGGPIIYDRDGIIPYIVTHHFQYFYWYFRFMKSLFGIQSFSGGNVIIQKNLFFQFDGFDENFSDQTILYPEDLDLAIRLNKARVRIQYLNAFSVYSSLRRLKRSPHHTILRTKASLQMLANN